MIGPWLFLAIGLLLLGLVVFLSRRSEALAQDHFGKDLPASLHAEIFPQRLAARLFGTEDWKFVAKQESAPLMRLFLQQRTALALALLGGVRANATRLIRVHSAAARTNLDLDPLPELKVVADYLFVQLLCQALAVLIWMRGPVDFLRLVGFADDLSKKLYEQTMRIFPAGLAAEENKPAPYLLGGPREG